MISLLWISLRYFFAPRRKTIHRLLILCYSAGIAVLLVILAVMNTLQGSIIENFISYESFHMQSNVHPELATVLQHDSALESIVEFQDINVLIQTETAGVIPALIRLVSRSYIRDYLAVDVQEPGLVIAASFAQRHDLSIGTSLRLTMVPENRTNRIRLIELPIAQYLVLPFLSNELFIAYYPLEDAYFADRASVRTGIFFDEASQAPVIQAKLAQRIPELTTRTWLEQNKNILAALRIEKTAIVFFMLLLFVVVAYCTAQMFGRSFIERYQDIALLRSMGASMGAVQLIFFGEALILAFFSGIFGTMAALFVTENLYDISEILIILRYSVQKITGTLPIARRPLSRVSLIPNLEGQLRFTTLFSVQLFCTIVVYLASARIIRKTKDVSLLLLFRRQEL